jgi:hypothetical protein
MATGWSPVVADPAVPVTPDMHGSGESGVETSPPKKVARVVAAVIPASPGAVRGGYRPATAFHSPTSAQRSLVAQFNDAAEHVIVQRAEEDDEELREEALSDGASTSASIHRAHILMMEQMLAQQQSRIQELENRVGQNQGASSAVPAAPA